jgi:hypothetical protein
MLTIDPPPESLISGARKSECHGWWLRRYLENLIQLLKIYLRKSEKGVSANDIHRNVKRDIFLFHFRNRSIPTVLVHHFQFNEVCLPLLTQYSNVANSGMRTFRG